MGQLWEAEFWSQLKAAFLFFTQYKKIFEEFHAGKANLYQISTLPLAIITISCGSKSPTATVTLYDTAVAQARVTSETTEQ